MKVYIQLLCWCCFTVMGFAQSITQLEYFFNEDPGFGKATAVTIANNTGNIEEELNISVTNLKEGFHKLYIRAKNAKNVWSLYDYKLLYVNKKANTKTVAAAEYFFDNDPGFGNGTTIPIETNTANVTKAFEISVSSLPSGFHKLYVRVKDDNNTWSLYDYKLLYIAKPKNNRTIIAAEYFFNDDPGFGKATTLKLIPNDDKPGQYVFEIPESDIECGSNKFYVRVKDSEGTWSLYNYNTELDIANKALPNITNKPEYDVCIEGDATEVTVSAKSLGITASDDCGIASLTLDNKNELVFNTVGAYKVTIKATDKGGKFTETETTLNVKECNLNVNDVALSNQIQLYPNPVTTTLQIITDLSIKNMLLQDVNGRVIQNIDAQSNALDMSNLASGVYIITLKVDNTVLKKRIIKD